MTKNVDFAKAVGEWGSQAMERLTAIHRRSVVLLGEEMTTTKPQGGRVPFDTGNLARSLLASTQAMPKTSEGPFSGSNVGLVAATLQPDEAAWLGYQSRYAKRRNYGFVGADSLGRIYNENGDYFVEGAIAKWPQIVAQAAREVKSNSK